VLSYLPHNEQRFGDRAIISNWGLGLLDNFIRDGILRPSVGAKSMPPDMLSRRRPPNFSPDVQAARSSLP